MGSEVRLGECDCCDKEFVAVCGDTGDCLCGRCETIRAVFCERESIAEYLRRAAKNSAFGAVLRGHANMIEEGRHHDDWIN